MKRLLRGLAVLLWLVSFVVAYLWFCDPSQPKYEPFLQLLALFALGVTAAAGWLDRRPIVASVKRLAPIRRNVELSDAHRDFLRQLNQSKVDYLVIAGFAGLFYGRVVETHDLDIWVGHHPDNITRLQSVINKLAPPYSIAASADAASGMVSIACARGAPIDISSVPKLQGKDFYSFYRRRERIIINGTPVSVISRHDHRQQTAYKFDPVET